MNQEFLQKWPVKSYRKKMRRWLFAGFLFCIIIIIAYYFAASRLLKPYIVNQIQQITGSKVDITKLTYGVNGSITITGFDILTPDENDSQTAILQADHIDILIDPLSVIKFAPTLSKIKVHDFEIILKKNLDTKKWNYQKLSFLNKSSQTKQNLPEMQFTGGKLLIQKFDSENTETILDIQLKEAYLRKNIKGTGGYFQLDIAQQSDFGGSNLSGLWNDGIITASGKFNASNKIVPGNNWQFEKINIQAKYDNDKITVHNFSGSLGKGTSLESAGEFTLSDAEVSYAIDINITNLLVTDKPKENSLSYAGKARDIIGDGFNIFLDRFNPKGIVDISAQAAGVISKQSKGVLVGQLNCKNVSIIDQQLFPYQFENVHGKIDFGSDGTFFDKLLCSHGSVDFQIDGYMKPPTVPGNKSISRFHLTSPNLKLDNDLYKALKPQHQKAWVMFTPQGSVELDYLHTRQPDNTKDVTIDLSLKDVSVKYSYFPYLIKNLNGKLILTSDHVQLKDITSIDKTRKLQVSGNIYEADTTTPRIDIDLKARGFAIDNNLRRALSIKQKESFDKIDITGNADFDVKVTQDPKDPGKVLADIDATVSGKEFAYKSLPIIINNYTLKALITPDGITLKKLKGKMNDGSLLVDGYIDTANNNHCQLNYSLKDVVLDNNLLQLGSLSPELANNINVSGKTNLSGSFIGTEGSTDANSIINIEFNDNEISTVKNDFKISNINGQATIDPTGLRLNNLSGNLFLKPCEQPKSKAPDKLLNAGDISLNGFAKLTDKKLSSCDIDMQAKKLNTHCIHRILNNTPIAQTLLKSNLNGTLDINSANLKIKADKTTSFSIKANTDLLNISLGKNNICRDITGNLLLNLKGNSETGLELLQGDFTGKNLQVNNFKFENPTFNFGYDTNTGYLWAKDIVSNLSDGQITGSASYNYINPDGDYKCQMSFDKVQIANLLTTQNPLETSNGTYHSGLTSGQLNISGKTSKQDSMQGRLNMSISNLHSSKETFGGELLKTAVKKQLDQGATYNQIIVDSYLSDNLIHFSEILLATDTIVFRGTGTTDIDLKDIDIELIAYGSTTAENPGMGESLARALGKRIARVEISGSKNDIKIVKKALPVLGDVLKVLGEK